MTRRTQTTHNAVGSVVIALYWPRRRTRCIPKQSMLRSDFVNLEIETSFPFISVLEGNRGRPKTFLVEIQVAAQTLVTSSDASGNSNVSRISSRSLILPLRLVARTESNVRYD